MIIETIAQAVSNVIAGLIGALPPAGALPSLDIGPVVSLAMRMNEALPVQESVFFLGYLLTISAAVFAFALARQIWRFVPIIGGG